MIMEKTPEDELLHFKSKIYNCIMYNNIKSLLSNIYCINEIVNNSFHINNKENNFDFSLQENFTTYLNISNAKF